MNKSNIADESARARKILAKTKAMSVNPSLSKKIELQQHKPLGESAVMCLVGPLGSHQYTICRPIGITDLSPNDWVCIPTEFIPTTLTRSVDPNKAAVDRARAVKRNELLLDEILLREEKSPSGERQFYYPSDDKIPRNAHLNSARAEMKATIKPLKKELSALPKKGAGTRRQELNTEIQDASDLLKYLTEKQARDESKIREFLSRPSTEEEVIRAHPYTHRTMTGTFGDQPQTAIVGAKGYPLIDVISALHKKFSCSLDLSGELGHHPTQPERSLPDAQRGREKEKKGWKISRSKSSKPRPAKRE